jgi:hypothetical protein
MHGVGLIVPPGFQILSLAPFHNTHQANDSFAPIVLKKSFFAMT